METLVNKILNKVQNYNKSNFDLEDIPMSDDDAANNELMERTRTFVPKSREELARWVYDILSKDGPNADLGRVDCALVPDLSNLFNSNAYNIEGTIANIIYLKYNTPAEKNLKKTICFYLSAINPNVSKWDVSNVTNMQMMFKGCTAFNCDLNSWHVDNVTNMCGLFNDCESFDKPLDKWHVDNCKEFSYMFYGCWNFNQNIDNWSLTNADNISSMFENCKSFNMPLISWGDKMQKIDDSIKAWRIFQGCVAFKQDISSWHFKHRYVSFDESDDPAKSTKAIKHQLGLDTTVEYMETHLYIYNGKKYNFPNKYLPKITYVPL